jgi:hypothetical protein
MNPDDWALNIEASGFSIHRLPSFPQIKPPPPKDERGIPSFAALRLCVRNVFLC